MNSKGFRELNNNYLNISMLVIYLQKFNGELTTALLLRLLMQRFWVKNIHPFYFWNNLNR